ncbi:hypothetical protein FWK35_00021648 [Aphis craccivora]|uniref:Uncharacterized protein n=1 Tax=Aphis craccivora TaxID=307492 RepID=A0A6G0X943_APHCR|nr:hypothetical protein FWK35_00021648 [Aphis craccivora]
MEVLPNDIETNNCSTLTHRGIMNVVPPPRNLSLVSLHLSHLRIVYPKRPNSASEISLVSHVSIVIQKRNDLRLELTLQQNIKLCLRLL